jgi:tRNA threonylcarbamoyladenosine biosynthesis protein TsaB
VNLLALETSTNACSVALLLRGSIVERHVVQAKEHTRLLIPMLGEVLQAGKATLADLDAIVLGNGPGSFIGMRIAASVAQGLAYGCGLNIVPVSSLAAVAAEAFQDTAVEHVAVAQDAHMNEVYLARFRRGEGGLPVADGETVLQPVGRVGSLEEFAPVRVHPAGAGWQRYPELLRLNADLLADVVDVPLPRASFLLRLGVAALREGAATEPAQLLPDYVRSRVASIPGTGRS